MRTPSFDKGAFALPDVTFGEVGTPPADWRKFPNEYSADDDEELEETPPYVVEMLGFDPKSE